MTFSKRIINLRFQLGQGDFGTAGQDTVELTGLRCSASISKAGGSSYQTLELRVWGLPLSVMNRLTVLNTRAFPQQAFNSVIVSAGDEASGTAVVFQGTIKEAWASGRDAPDVSFHVSAFSGLFESMKPIPPTSYKGSVDIALALSGIAQQAGLRLENSGVTGHVSNPYWPGSLGSQLKDMCDAVRCEYLIDTAEHVLAVWPRGQSRNDAAILLAKDTGMVAYPDFTETGVRVTSLFNPNLAFGRTIKVQSDFAAANGQWVIAAISHNLDANMPNGQWFTEVECGLLGEPLPIIG